MEVLGLLDSKLQLEKSHEMGSEKKMYSVANLPGSEFVFSKHSADSNEH